MNDPRTDHLFRLQNRRRIYEHIRRMPGVHLRQIQRDLGMSMGTLEYHLRRLEKSGLLVTRETNRFKSYFALGELDRRDKDYLYYLRQRMPRKIAAEIARDAELPLKQLVQRMPIAPSTLSFHLKKLVRSQIVLEYAQGREKYLKLANPIRMHRLLSTYGPLWEAHNRADEASRALSMRDLMEAPRAAQEAPGFELRA
ncbi:MAG: helix-turn-helix domain-containing protein [Euryarchaeota archaeon]|nr:helix-turn-helix domain-containing protein [Euryarchaeota archaeon]